VVSDDVVLVARYASDDAGLRLGMLIGQRRRINTSLAQAGNWRIRAKDVRESVQHE
jgi:hypothetical protein